MAEAIEASQTNSQDGEARTAPSDKPKRARRSTPPVSAAEQGAPPASETGATAAPGQSVSQTPTKSRDAARRGEPPFVPWFIKRGQDQLQRMSKQSMPFRKQQLTLQTRHAQEMYERAHEMWSETVITLSVTMRNFKPENECLIVDAEVDTLLGTCETFIKEEMVRLQTVADNNGVDLEGATDVEYTHPMTFDMQITSPREKRFHDLMRQLDKLCIYLDILWMATLINDRARSKSAYEAKSLIMRTCGKARTLVFRAQASSQRNGKHNAQDPRKGTAIDANGAQSENPPTETDAGKVDAHVPVADEPSEAVAAVA